MTSAKLKMSVLLAVIALAMIFLASCAVETPPADAEMRRITDDIGREISISPQITRIVSLAPNITELVFAAGAGDRLVGVTTYCNFPADAEKIAKIGDTMTPNMESIVALKPDIVIVSTASQVEAFTKTLEQNGIAVFVVEPTGVDDVIADLEKLAELFGTTKSSRAAIDALRQRIAAVDSSPKAVERPRVVVQISREPLFTIGSGSFINEIVERAGGVSLTKEIPTAYPKLSKEAAIKLSPDVIVLSDGGDNRAPNDAFRASPAAKNDRIVRIDADLLSRPGPRLVDALEQMTETLRRGKAERN